VQIMSASETTRSVRELTTETSNIAAELDLLPHRLAKLFVYLLVKVPEALRSSMYESRARYGQRSNQETYSTSGGLLLPVIRCRKRSAGRVKVVLRMLEPKHSVSAVHDVYYSRGSVVFLTRVPEHEEEFANYVGRRLFAYTFPPRTLESYLFFHLNPQIQEILSDYLNGRGSELPESFLSKVSLYTSAENAVGPNDSLPEVEARRLRYMKLDLDYKRFEGRLREFRLVSSNYIYDLTFGSGPPDVRIIEYSEYGISFIEDKDPSPVYWLRTDAYTLPYISKLAGFDRELKHVLNKLKATDTYMRRAALIFTVLKKVEE